MSDGGTSAIRVQVTAEARAVAKSTRLVETDGGPLLLVSGSALRRWGGLDGDDYERACEADDLDVLRVGDGKAVVLGSPDATGLVVRGDEVLVVRQLGADRAADVFAAALALAASATWKATRRTLTVRGGLWLVDATEDGAALARRKSVPRSAARVSVRPGEYALETAGEFDVEAVEGARVGAVLFELHRLRRKPST